MKRYSRKREAILHLLKSTACHPTAEWIYAQLKPEIPDLSLSTVYRNLNEFLAEGEAVSVGVYDGQQRYDGETSPHMHFLCEKCGRILDVETEIDKEINRSVEKNYGCQVRNLQAMFIGSCEACRQTRDDSSLL